MLQGGGGNIGVIADASGIVMIDSMDENSAGQIREALKTLPGAGKIRFLINTQWLELVYRSLEQRKSQ